MKKTLLAAIGAATLAAAPAQAAERASTAGARVSVLQPLAMPGLERARALRIYLPPSYASAPERRYPVLYMHDGQNLFDDATAYAGEWGVDETLDALARTHGFEAIVVGIDNGGARRMVELSPVAHPRIGAAEGPQYMSFVVDTVKPLIDRDYRTLPDRANTAIIGSSMGGLISHYAIQRYPDVFGKAGVFSPAYWVSPQLFDRAAALPLAPDARVWLFAGGREGGDMESGTRRMHEVLRRAAPADEKGLNLHIEAQAQHNEAAWRTELPTALVWLFQLAPR